MWCACVCMVYGVWYVSAWCMCVSLWCVGCVVCGMCVHGVYVFVFVCGVCVFVCGVCV